MSQSNVEVQPAAAPVAAPAAPAVVAPPVAAAPIAAPASPATAAPVAAPAATAIPPADEPNWFKPRVEQAKRSGANEVLGKLGVKDADEAKALIDAAKASAEAAKSELQKAQEKGKSADSLAARVVDLEKTIKARADVELASLTEAQKAAVMAVAGDDSARTLSTIDALKPTWVTAPPPVVAPAAVIPPAATAPPAVPPATTSPPPNAPGGSPTTSPPDRKAEYASLKAKNPHAAALYLNQYVDEIYPRS
jgi:hypothetical protein